MTKFAVIILNYNSASDTVNLVHKLDQMDLVDTELVVVDNKSRDESSKILPDLKTETPYHFIQSDTNGGYAAGNNLGLRYAAANGSEFCLIMNTDVSIHSQLLQELYDYMKDHIECAIVSPSLEINNNLIKYGKKIRLGKINFQKQIQPTDSAPISVEVIDGACFMVRMSAVKAVGYIPENYFLNFEETEWCIRFQRANFEIICLPKVVVRHQENGIIGKVSGLQVYFLRRNLVLFNKRMASRRQYFGLLIKLLFWGSAQSIKNRSIAPLKAYIDGITERNQFVK
ncbi:Glycosyl transferase family 2 [Lactiplantibacillus plantarum]|nr:Glycosyl transferase family 2 [Lactiplantibacillus plantarum]MBP5841813.1 glycosyltransferase family 2 protein [Lactiplantibacillus plantarum]